MKIFIDESGCPGFKFFRGSDPIFGIGMVIFSTAEDARITEQTIGEIRRRMGHKPEFKFSKSSDRMRDDFFAGVARCPFTVRALIVRKDVVESSYLRTHVNEFYSYFARMLMTHDGGVLNDAEVRIDGSGSRKFRQELNAYLRQQLGNRIKDVKMSDSARDPLMQLADMCIGAITRVERQRANADRWKRMLGRRIGDVWQFR